MAEKKDDKEKWKTLSINERLAKLEKDNGLQPSLIKDVKVVPTGSYKLDEATGIGGYPAGKVIEIFGPESSGKSTMALHAIAEFQKKYPDKKVGLFDYEHSFDKAYAKSLGVDLTLAEDGVSYKRLLIYQPDHQEQGYQMIVGLAEQGICSLIVLDSHTAATPKNTLEGDMTDASYALQARNNSKFLLKIKGILDRSECTLFAVSQLRMPIGGMQPKSGQAPSGQPTGGMAFKFYSDMRLKVWKELDKPNEANTTTVDVVKNKCASPYGQAKFDIEWGQGINKYKEILDVADEYGIVKRSGTWYSYEMTKLGQGAFNACTMFKDNPEVFEEILQKVRNHETVKQEKVFVEKAVKKEK